ncbi:MAG: Apolipoprotein N-acyltransferase [Elusimicrobia bacterium ADurb.Bin231]|nr:MAG: Apolipoprotein N-acyltransferase [Elusimicrobia bacterium ADurb.Bin231]
MTTLLLCFLSSLLTIISFPKSSLWFMGWVCLAPYLYATHSKKPITAFLYGILTGLVAYCGILYWVIPTFIVAGEHPVFGVLALILLSAYLSLYIGIFGFFNSASKGKTIFLLPFLWVALEYLRTHLFTGFPWAILGYSQWNNLPVIQISEYTSVYGVSFLLISANIALAKFLSIKGFRKFSGTELFFFLTCAISIVFSIGFGYLKLRDNPSEKSYAEVSVLQGNIDQYKKWDSEYEIDIMQKYGSLAYEASKDHPSLIVWPETAVPGYLVNDLGLYNYTLDIIKKSGTHHLIGSVSMKKGKNFNSAFLVSDSGEIYDAYSKRHLVPFGEYVPLRKFLGRFIKSINKIGETSRGKKSGIMRSPAGLIGVNICFESIFPNEIRRFSDAEFIINITNDAWYLKTSAPYQHFAMNIFRAVENRRDLVRSANTGISGFISASGRIRNKTEIFTDAVLTDKVLLRKDKTFYSQYGDVFAQISFFISIIWIFSFIFTKKA